MYTYICFCLEIILLTWTNPSLHCSRLYAKSSGMRGGDGAEKPGTWPKPKHLACQLHAIFKSLKASPSAKQNEAPLVWGRKYHEQKADQQPALVINHVSTLGRNTVFPKSINCDWSTSPRQQLSPRVRKVQTVIMLGEPALPTLLPESSQQLAEPAHPAALGRALVAHLCWSRL